MRNKTSHTVQATKVLPIALLWAFATIFLAVLFLQESIPYQSLLLDPELTASTPWYAGILWGFSLVCWVAAAVAAAGAAWICKLAQRHGAAAMLARGAALSTLFLVNDLFQLMPRLASFLNSSETPFALVLIMIGGLWFFIERAELKRTRVELVTTALIALCSALVMRTAATELFGVDTQRALIASSAAELLGVLAWAQYFILTGADIVRSVFMNLRVESRDAQSSDRPPNQDLGKPPSTVTMTRRERPKERT